MELKAVYNVNATILEIAQQHLDISTLNTQNSDSLDFKELAVWQIKTALEEAFRMGWNAGVCNFQHTITTECDELNS